MITFHFQDFRLKGLTYVIQIQCECREWSKAFARNVIVSFVRIESFWAFNLGFNSSMKRIQKFKQSNLDGHFVKTGKSMKHSSFFLLQHELVCLKYYFLLPPCSFKECWSSLGPCLPEFPAATAWSEVLEVPVKGSKLDSHWKIPLLQSTYI